jgi:hypothetical protein
MADRKISDLTALTTPAAGDYVPIVDISEAAAASKNKRITIEELFRGTPDGTAALPSVCPESDPNTGTFSPGADQWGIATNGIERWRITSGGVIAYNQAAPTAVNTTATLTVADLQSGIITSTTAAAVTGTLPTGTLTEGGFTGIYTNFAFEWTVINTGATNTFTVQAGTDHTLVGSGAVAANQAVRFLSRRTAANTFVTYRLS